METQLTDNNETDDGNEVVDEINEDTIEGLDEDLDLELDTDLDLNEGDDPEKKPEPEKTFSQKDVDDIVQKRVGREKKTIADLEAQTNALLKKYEPGDADIVLPEEPDVLDVDYDLKKQEFEDLKLKKEVALAEGRVYEKIKAQAAQTEFNAKVAADADGFKARASKLGFSDAEILNIDDKLGAAGVGQEVANYVVNRPAGALIADYLVKNPSEVEKIKQMSVVDRILYLDKDIKAKAKGKTIKKPANTTTGDKPSAPSDRGGGKVSRNAKFS